MPETSEFDWVTPPPFTGPIDALDRAGRPLDGDQNGALDVFEDDEPTPDHYGRLRVHDVDTGHVRTITAEQLPHGNYAVLDEPASDPTGLPIPPEHNRFPVETTPDGQEADPQKENGNA